MQLVEEPVKIKEGRGKFVEDKSRGVVVDEGSLYEAK